MSFYEIKKTEIKILYELCDADRAYLGESSNNFRNFLVLVIAS